jgi:prolyl oligopeptidase
MNLVALALASLLVGQAAPAPQPPRAPRRPVTETHHGVEVVDPYRWLEDSRSPEVKAWSEAQAAAARTYLDGLPNAKEIREQVKAIMLARSPTWSALEERHGSLFARKSDPGRQQPVLVWMASPDDPSKERVLLDPQAVDPSGATTIDWFVPSPDGRKIAISLSRGGTESGDVQVFDVASMKPIEEPLRRVHGGTAGGSLAWNRDGSGFWYTRYPREGERAEADLAFYQQVWFHELGKPGSTDRKELGDELPRIAEVELHAKRDGKWILARVKNGDGGEVELWLRPSGKGAWRRLSRFTDLAVNAEFGEGQDLYVLSRKGAPRGRILHVPLPPPGADPLGRARVVVPQGTDAIEGVVAVRDRLYVSEMAGGPSRLRMVATGGKALGEVPILPVSTVYQVVPVPGRGILFQNVSWVDPIAWYSFDPAKGRVAKTRLAAISPVDLSGAEAVRGWATSKDGTRVPVDVVRMKGAKLDGDRPTILYGYGGYGISERPYFSAMQALWLLNGGVYANAVLRGGGEFGEEWHLAGNLTRKQNVFDDFIAAAGWLVQEGYTRPQRLALLGGSNGGLLVNAVVTQRPDVCRAAASLVGISDMVRVETTSNGAFNVTEFGTVKDPEQFRALYAYSPYHHVVDGTRYPAVLLTAGEGDPRVDSWQAKKMAARLQEANASGLPVVLRLSGWGHGIGTSRDQAISEGADLWSFFFAELGVPFHPIAVAAPRTR